MDATRNRLCLAAALNPSPSAVGQGPSVLMPGNSRPRPDPIAVARVGERTVADRDPERLLQMRIRVRVRRSARYRSGRGPSAKVESSPLATNAGPSLPYSSSLSSRAGLVDIGGLALAVPEGGAPSGYSPIPAAEPEGVADEAVRAGVRWGPNRVKPFGCSTRWTRSRLIPSGPAAALASWSSSTSRAPRSHCTSTTAGTWASTSVDGEYSLVIADETVTASPLTWVYVPRGTPHAWRCDSLEVAFST
jgi:hypothetical protein